MKQIISLTDCGRIEICLANGNRIEIDGNNVKHLNKDGKVLYDSESFLYAQEPVEFVGVKHNNDEWEYDDYDADWN